MTKEQFYLMIAETFPDNSLRMIGENDLRAGLVALADLAFDVTGQTSEQMAAMQEDLEQTIQQIYEQFSLANGLGTLDASTGIATIKETGVSYTITAVANQPNGMYFDVDKAGSLLITGKPDPIAMLPGGVVISRGTKWDYIPKSDAGLAKINALLDVVAAPANIITQLTSGYWPAGAANTGIITASAASSHSNLIPIATGETIIFEGLNNSLLSTIMGLVFREDNTGAINLVVANFVAIPGGHKYVVPSVSTGAKLGINLRNVDTVRAYKGLAVVKESSKIKPAALPEGPTKLSEFINDAGYAKTSEVPTAADLFEMIPPPANIANFVTGFYASNATTTAAVTASSTYAHTMPIPCDVNNSFSIKGLSSTLAIGTLGKFFNSAGQKVGNNIVPADLVEIPGGHRLDIPVLAGVALFALNKNVADVSVSIQAGGAVVDEPFKQIKASLIPPSELSDNSEELALNAFNRGKSVKPLAVKKFGILLCGQSNADGRIDATEQPAFFTGAGRVLTGVNFCNNDVGTFANYSLGAGDQFGFELFLYKDLLDYLRTKYADPNYSIYAVKKAVGGTPISELSTVNSTAYWQPFTENIPAGKSALMLLAETRLRKALELAGADFSIRCIVWHQGEADSTGGAPAAYYKNLKCIISYFRGVLDNPKVAFVIGGINKSSVSYNETVNLASRRLADEDPFVYYAEVLDTTAALKSDVQHFNAVGGQDIATSILNIIKDF